MYCLVVKGQLLCGYTLFYVANITEERTMNSMINTGVGVDENYGSI